METLRGMPCAAPPSRAAWRHIHARDGFEIVYLRANDEGWRVEGHTVAVEAGVAWAIAYLIELDTRWVTRRARVFAHWAERQGELSLDADGKGRWWANGVASPGLDGCLDVDLAASAFTNALPVRRLDLGIGERADAPAAYVRAEDLAVERLEQEYRRVESAGVDLALEYRAPVFGYEGRLVYDAAGLVLAYPGIAERVA